MKCKKKFNKISEKLPVKEDCLNNRTLLVGPSFSGKTCLILEIFSQLPDRDIFEITSWTVWQF